MTDLNFELPGRTGHIAVAYDDGMLVWGGCKEHGDNQDSIYLNGAELNAYHIPTEKWFFIKCHGDFPPGTSGASAMIACDHLYLFGGYRSENYSNSLYCLDLEDFHWEHLKPNGCPPTPVDKTVGWEHKRRLYFFGGFGPATNFTEGMPKFQFVFADTPHLIRGWTNQLVAYDIENNEWYWPECKGRPPIARAAHAATVLNNKAYIFGGRHNTIRMNDLHCLDLETMTWSGKLDISGKLPAGRSWHSLNAVSGEYLILYGGFSQNNVPLSDCWLLNTKNLLWIPVELPFQKPRLWHSACVNLYNEVVIYGGCTENILDANIIAEHAKDIIVLRISPKSLYRICMDEVVKNSDRLRQQICVLPIGIQDTLCSRLRNRHLPDLDDT